MKNLLVYIHPKRSFDKKYSSSVVELQLDLALDFWSAKDIVFLTNFPYKYREVKSIVVPDDLYCPWDKRSSKINGMIYALEHKIVDELTWCHDLDAYQINPLNLELKRDIGFVPYGFKEGICCGSIFIKPGGLKMFKDIQARMYKVKKSEERVIMNFIERNYDNINDKCQIMDQSYNIGMGNTPEQISSAEKPIKIVHFDYSGILNEFKPILTKRFIDLFYEKFTSLHQSSQKI